MSRLGRALSARADAVLLTPGGAVSGPDLAAAPSAALAPALAAGVALAMAEPRALLRALAALDGRAAKILLLAPGLAAETALRLVAEAGVAAIVSDTGAPGALSPEAAFGPCGGEAARATAWLLTTSGTTGTPKIVAHSLDGLARTVKPAPAGATPVWGLVYEPTRFAGLQVVLQAVLGGGRLAATRADAPIAEKLAHLAAAGATHVSATPTLWRRILMDPAAAGLAPTHVTLGGEIADDAILRALARRYPAARLRHIYASTEAGVGFSVKDGRAGFPAAWLAEGSEGVALRLAEGRLWIRPPGAPPAPIAHDPGHDAEGFLDTGDRVAVEGDRVRFLGREAAAVNIGGAKVSPEEVEARVNAHPEVALARVSVRPSPITGALLTLAVVPADAGADPADLRRRLAAHCRETLPREARPARIALVPRAELEGEITAAGKLSRGGGA